VKLGPGVSVCVRVAVSSLEKLDGAREQAIKLSTMRTSQQRRLERSPCVAHDGTDAFHPNIIILRSAASC
jgi:hypothetical protein